MCFASPYGVEMQLTGREVASDETEFRPNGKPKLAIIGAGYLGCELAKALERVMDVTLIERASHFTHAPAMITGLLHLKFLVIGI